MLSFFPQPCPAALEDSYIQLCQELATHCYWSSALTKDHSSRILCCTDPQLGEIDAFDFQDIAKLARLATSGAPHAVVPLRNFHTFLPQCFSARRPAVCDGAGLFSNADHMSLLPARLQCMRPQKIFWHILNNITCAQHLREGTDSEPLSEQHGAVIAEIIRRKVDPEGSTEHGLTISPGQPFRLNLLHSIATAIGDKDAQLPLLLEQGVPAGAFDPPAFQWAVDSCTAQHRYRVGLARPSPRALPGQLDRRRAQP